MTRLFPFNTMEGVCRTIKAQYYKTGMVNFIRDNGFAATGVITYEQVDRNSADAHTDNG